MRTGPYWPASETPFKCRFAGGPRDARNYMLVPFYFSTLKGIGSYGKYDDTEKVPENIRCRWFGPGLCLELFADPSVHQWKAPKLNKSHK